MNNIEKQVEYIVENYGHAPEEAAKKICALFSVRKRLEIDFDGSLKAEIVINNTDKDVLKVLRAVNGYGQMISPEYVTITDSIS